MKAKVSIHLDTIIGIAAYAGTYWQKAEFISKVGAEAYLDPIYQRSDIARQMQIDSQIYDLREQVWDITEDSLMEERPMKGWEKAKIQRLNNRIKELGGEP